MKENWLDFWRHFRENRAAVLGLVIVIASILTAVFANFMSPHDPSAIFSDSLQMPPVWSDGGEGQFLLGTDDLGRDLLSRILFGARVSMQIGLFVVIFALLIGTVFGLLAGFYGGWVDATLSRVVDILMSLPSILLAIVVVSILGPSFTNSIIAVGVVAIPGFFRITRASVEAEKRKNYVVASRCFGASRMRLIFVHILPNCLAPILVQATLGFSDAILNAAALGFLGLGAQPPTPEWGTMLADGRAYIESAPWLVTLPGLCILVVVLGFNIFGDGLRDALDPKLRKV